MCLNLLHSEQPKLHGILAVPSAIGLNIGTPKNINFPSGPNGKLMVLGASIL